MHRREIKKFASKAYEQGLTLVPLKMYFKEGRAKVLLGICKGRKLYDKREVMKKKTMQRDISRALREDNRHSGGRGSRRASSCQPDARENQPQRHDEHQ